MTESYKHGLFVEFKRKRIAGQPNPVVSPDQKEMIELLSRQGYMAVVCYGFDEARIITLEHMRGIR